MVETIDGGGGFLYDNETIPHGGTESSVRSDAVGRSGARLVATGRTYHGADVQRIRGSGATAIYELRRRAAGGTTIGSVGARERYGIAVCSKGNEVVRTNADNDGCSDEREIFRGWIG